MKNVHQNLLLILALSLCVLCAYQWYGQTLQRNEAEELNRLLYQQSAAIQGYTNSIRNMDHQMAELSAQVAEFREAAKTNEQLAVVQKREINKLQTVADGMTNQIVEYKKAVGSLETKLKEAYDGIRKQNDALKDLATQRDEFVKKFNDSVQDRNDIVTKYNELAAQVQKLQGGGK